MSGLAVITDGSVTIIDDLGREVTLDHPAERIAFQHYATAEALRIVGVWDRVVARDGYITDFEFFPGLNTIPALNPPSGNLDLNYETIVSAKPDLMIIQKQDWMKSQIDDAIEKLEPEIPVIVLDFIDPQMIPESFSKLGAITGNEDKAEDYIEFARKITNKIDSQTSMLSDADKPEVFLKAPAYKQNQIFTYGNGMAFWADMLQLSGGKNVVTNQSAAWFEVDPEWILHTDMDTVVVHCRQSLYPEIFGYLVSDRDAAGSGAESIIANISGSDEFMQKTAVKNHQVYVIADPMTGTPRSIVGIAYLAKWLHPDLFSDLDPKAVHQQYLSDFIGASYDLNKTGFFAYPA